MIGLLADWPKCRSAPFWPSKTALTGQDSTIAGVLPLGGHRRPPGRQSQELIGVHNTLTPLDCPTVRIVACQRTGAAVVRFADVDEVVASEGAERRGSAPWQCRCKARAMTRSDPEWGRDPRRRRRRVLRWDMDHNHDGVDAEVDKLAGDSPGSGADLQASPVADDDCHPVDGVLGDDGEARALYLEHASASREAPGRKNRLGRSLTECLHCSRFDLRGLSLASRLPPDPVASLRNVTRTR